jgi:hypothetical protein
LFGRFFKLSADIEDIGRKRSERLVAVEESDNEDEDSGDNDQKK